MLGRLGPYVLLRRVGEGVTGRVFEARHRLMDRVAAVKVLRKKWLAYPTLVSRFRREIRAAAQLDHPNLVGVYDAGRGAGTYFLVMEYVRGIDLFQLVQRCGPLSFAQACDYVAQAALGLQHLHEHGYVHRDVKPSHLLVTPAGVVKLIDLSITRPKAAAGDAPSAPLTETGVFLGTPDFTAPEQTQDARRAGPRADLYSLGATLYYLLTGQVPFPGGTPGEKLSRHRLEKPLPLQGLRPDVPPSLAAVVYHLMAKRPEDRYQTPAELVAALGFFRRLPSQRAVAAL